MTNEKLEKCKQVLIDTGKPKVYAIKSGGYVKIGLSKDPVKRLQDLQIGNPTTLVLWGIDYILNHLIKAATSDQSLLTWYVASLEEKHHNCLSQYHHRGEWFILTEEVINYIETMFYIIPSAENLGKTRTRTFINLGQNPLKIQEPVHHKIQPPRKLLTTTEAAKVLGVGPQTMFRWRKEGRGPSYMRISTKHIRYLLSDVVSWGREQTTT